jgi:ABC-2 type transport system permease protein
VFFVLLGESATGRNTAEFYIVGNAMVMASVTAFAALSLAVMNERAYGTLAYLIASPANRLAIFFGRAVINILDGATTVVICFAWGLVLGLDLSRCNLPGLALTILVVTVSATGLGLLVGSVSYITLNVLFIVNTVFFLLLVFSGANVPLDRLPDWMQAVSTVLPLTRGIQAARLFVTSAPLAEVWPLIAGEFVVGATYALAGFGVFRWFENQARSRGTLEAF